MKKLPQPNFKMDYVPLQGGEDLITPSLTVDPGRAYLTQNYELDVDGRYRLIDGYEAFDGRPKPSAANYYILNFDHGATEINVGDIVTGAVGSGEALLIRHLTGTWAGGDAAGYLVLFNVTTGYVDNENLLVGAAVMATANGVESLNGADTDTLDSIYTISAIAARRADIAAVPGSGNILGVWLFNGTVYAFRNNAGGTAGAMYKSSAAGWVLCTLGRTVAFTSGGTTAIAEGNTVTGAVSGATGVVGRVILASGTWAGGDAAGTLVLTSQTGTFQAENLDVGASLDLATIGGNSTATTLPVGGTYRFITHNFGGHAGQRRMYGCNGVGKAFEWDGTVFVPLTTGMVTDTPTHIIAHRNHLFLAFPGGSVQHSSLPAAPADPVFPYKWSVVTGAGEIGIGDEITGFLSMPTVMAIFARNSTYLLYGASSTDWDLRGHSDEAGAISNTVQKIGAGIYLDDRGLTSLTATDKYGDFQANALSKFIEPYLKAVKSLVQSSARVKTKNQYRLFLTNLGAITLTLDGEKVIGFTRQAYDKLPVCVCSAENSSGDEEIYFGSTDGFVYQMDVGTSFNGNPIEATIKFHFNHLDTPSIVKRIRKITLELDAPIYTYINANVEFDYGETGNPGEFYATESPGGTWDISSWDSFVWNGRSVSSTPIKVDGNGMNFSLTIYHSGEWELQPEGGFGELPLSFPRTGVTNAQPHTIQGYTVHYDLRKVQR